MRKFRHKATGAIAEENNHFMCYTIKHERLAESMIDRNIIENSNDWELIESSLSRAETIKLSHKEEPNYLITAFKCVDLENKSFVRLCKDGKYYDNIVRDTGMFTLEDMLYKSPSVQSGAFEIYSVKNSKGEEFTIGDVIKRNDKDFKLISFAIHKEGCYVIGEDKFGQIQSSINLLRKPKSPIYTTTDNNAIFKGDSLTLFLLRKPDSHCVLPYQKVDIFQFSERDKEVADRYLTFTSEENRDKYIKENTRKPIFVSADGVELFEGDKYYPVNIGKNEYYTWKTYECENEGLSEKTTIYKHIAYFSTEEARQEYIDNNKPKYSLMDIENAYCKAMNSEFDGFGEIIEELKKLGKWYIVKNLFI